MADPQSLLAQEKWVESGFAALQKLPETCARLNQRVAESEHVALAFLADENGMMSRVLLAAGASPKEVREGFEAYAARPTQETLPSTR